MTQDVSKMAEEKQEISIDEFIKIAEPFRYYKAGNRDYWTFNRDELIEFYKLIIKIKRDEPK